MSLLTLLGIAIGLGMDAFAVSVAAGVKLCRVSPAQMTRMALAFGFFQFIMPVFGWLAGRTVVTVLQAIDHWVAFGLLAVVGGHMIWGGLNPKQKGLGDRDPTRGWLLFTLTVATSIDALAVGLGFSVLQVSIWLPALIIGLMAAAMTVLGLQIGCRVGLVFGKRMEILGGLILIIIGLNILRQHLM